jgi:PAS domain S-box-containing protein
MTLLSSSMIRSIRSHSRILLTLCAVSILFLLIQLITSLALPTLDPHVARTLSIAVTVFAVCVLALVFSLITKLTNLLDVGEFNLAHALDETQKLTQVIDTSFDGIVLTDTRGVIRHVNPKWIAITGWTKEETEGKMTPAVLKSGYHDTKFYTDFWLTIQHGMTFHGELINKRKDGGYYRVDEIVLPIKDTRGLVSGYAAFHHVLEPDYKPKAPPPEPPKTYTEAS